MSKATKQSLLAIVAVAAAAGSLYYGLGSRSPQISLDTYSVLGAVTAEETAALLANKGQVLVILRDTRPDKNPADEAELSAFQQTLNKQKGLKLITERVQLTPLDMMSTGGAVPSEQMFKLLQSHPGLNALVLFLALPSLGEAELETLRKSGVKVVVVSSLHPAYSRLLEQHAIHLAIVPRPEPPPAGSAPPQTLRERFDQDFSILRSASKD